MMNLNKIMLQALSKVSKKTLLNFANGVFEENIKDYEVIMDVQVRKCNFLNFIGNSLISGEIRDKRKNNYCLIEVVEDEAINMAYFEFVRDRDGYVSKMNMKKQYKLSIKDNVDNIETIVCVFERRCIEYDVPIINIFEYSLEEMKKKRLYPLIPFQILRLERELGEGSENNNIKEKTEKISGLSEQLNTELKELSNNGFIEKMDLEILISVNKQLCSYVMDKIVNF